MPIDDGRERLQRAMLALEGLSVGDAFGEAFFVPEDEARRRIARREPPPPPWRFTDDTEMAIAVVETLAAAGRVDPDELAARLARRYRAAPWRGYGGGAHRLLGRLARGASWREEAPALFEGQGSFGNGAAMRVAPVGAYFADEPERVVAEADASAAVTHAHPEGRAGAIAVAVAAATAAARTWKSGRDLLVAAHAATPEGRTREGLARALELPEGTSVEDAAAALGHGARVSAPDTVPFALWCAAQSPDDYEKALWTTVAGLGDRDTTCAIVGGIVVLAAGLESIPKAWRAAREPLPEGLGLALVAGPS